MGAPRPPRILVPLFLAIAGSLAAPAAFAQASEPPRIELEARLWSAEPSGDVRVVEGDLGTTIDLESDLGLEDDEALEGRLTFHPSRRTSVRLAWTNLTFSGDNVLSRTIEFNGETFTVATRVVSELDFDYGRVGFVWQFLGDEAGRFRFGPVVEAKGFRGEASIEAPDLLDLGIEARESEEFEAAFGAAGLALDVEPTSRVHLFAEGTVVVAADEGDATDLEAGVRVLLVDQLAVTAGYRRFAIDAEEDDDDLDFDITGAFLGLNVRF